MIRAALEVPMPDVDARIRSMPKAELHRHLEGCLTPAIVLEAAQRFRIDLPYRTLEELERHVVLRTPLTSLQEVLLCFRLYQQLFVSEDAVRYLVRRVVEDAAADNVRYLELRFSPAFMAAVHSLPLPGVIEATIEAASEAAAHNGVVAALLVIATRELGPQVCREAFDLAARYVPHVAGVDLAGDEDSFSTSDFRAAFDRARAAGLKVTVHAGEQGHPENVASAVMELGADRIGHGIRIVDRPDLMALLADRNVPLEISLTSNWIVGAVASVGEHPVRRLAAAGVPITLSSDDPGLFGITLSSELALYCDEHSMPFSALIEAQLTALEHGFASEIRKGLVRNLLLEWSKTA
jgi:adenosine deaminase